MLRVCVCSIKQQRRVGPAVEISHNTSEDKFQDPQDSIAVANNSHSSDHTLDQHMVGIHSMQIKSGSQSKPDTVKLVYIAR